MLRMVVALETVSARYIVCAVGDDHIGRIATRGDTGGLRAAGLLGLLGLLGLYNAASSSGNDDPESVRILYAS